MRDIPLRDLCVAYAFLPFITPARARLLLDWFVPLSRACNAPSTVLQQLLAIDAEQAQSVKNPLRTPEMRDAVDAWRDRAITLFDDARYPPLLRETIDPPLALFYRGDPTVLARTSIAIVGSRRASPYAVNVATLLAQQLASAGVAVVSGLARGVDTAAHEGALHTGTTIAVLGTGIDVVYPRANRKLFDRIAERGVIVTEFPPGTPPKRPHFPIRNRVISGIAKGTVIVEATSRSGSLITARTAAEQGRDVFCVPGSIFAPGSEGTHRLIQYGAKLVHDVHDIVEEIPPQSSAASPDEPLREVLEAFARDAATHLDTAAQKLGRSVPQMSEAVLQLELGGWLRAIPGGRWIRQR